MNSAEKAINLEQSPLSELSFCAIDFESAGAASGETDYPVQVGIMRCDSLFSPKEERQDQHFCSYIACTHPIHWRASKIHGISTKDLHHAPSMLELWIPLKKLLRNCIVVGHNPSTELKFLRHFPAHGFGPWLDTLTLARRVVPNAPDYSLGTVCEMLGLKAEIDRLVPHKQWHDAHYDAAASLELLRFIISELKLEHEPLSRLDFALREG